VKNYLLMWLAVLLANLAGSAAAEELLYERSLNLDRSVNFFTTNEFDLDLTLGDRYFNPTNPLILFDDLLITPSDVGSVFEILVGDPSLAAAEQRLTDARDEFIRLVLSENRENGRSEERGSSESGFFLGLENLPGPDLAGAILQRIRLEIESFTLVGDGSPGGVSPLTTGPPVDLQVKISLFGVVPEPTSLWLLWSGLATLWGVTRRRLARPVLAPVRVRVSSVKR